MLILQMLQFRSLLLIAVLFFGGAALVCPQKPKPIRATWPEGSVAFAFPKEMNTFEVFTPATTSAFSQAKGWRGIVPLHSSRRDLERNVGSPKTLGGSSYETTNENVFVEYSDGPCEKGWPFGWDVPLGTVLMISISPKSTMLLSDLRIDESKYQKSHETHLNNMIHYVNYEDGVDVRADEFSGKVLSVTHMPTAQDNHLRCPEASRRLPPGRSQADSFFKFDEYGDIPFSYERERLDLFAAEVKRQPNSEGYIIAYAGMIAHAGEAKARAGCAKNYLIKKHHIKAKTVFAIDGGYRETRLVELYVEPRGGDLPLARPTVRPSKVKIMGSKKSISCDIGSLKK